MTHDGYCAEWYNRYDAHDNLIGTTNPLNQATTYGYSAKNQLLFITNALNQITKMLYDQNSNMTNLVDALNHTNSWLYDANGRNYLNIYADGSSNSLGYDAIGRLAVTTNHGSGLVLTYGYDNLDRRTDINFPDSTSIHYEYLCCGLDWVSDRLGHETHYDYDALQRVKRVTDPLERITEFGYNGADQITNLTTYVGSQPRVKRFDYTSTNGFSRLTGVTTPMGKQTRYGYTFRGALAWRQDGNGNVIEFQNDAVPRLKGVTDNYNNPLISLDYDALNNVTEAISFGDNSTRPYSDFVYSYDPLNRPTNAICTIASIPGFATVRYQIAYQFDAVGNLTNRTITGLRSFADNIQTRYGYDVMNRLTTVTQLVNSAQTATAAYTYDAAGRLQKKTYGNNDIATYAYDAESRLLNLGITNGTTSVQAYSYGWDAGGNILALTNFEATGSVIPTYYAYDDAGQLTSETCGATTTSWQYDEAGNWLNASSSTKWVYDADNELVARGNSSDNTFTVTVTGTVDPGNNNNKWYQTTASCRGVSALVNSNNGTFSLPNVPLNVGANDLVVTVTDVSGNTSQQTRHVTKNCYESFAYDGNGNLTNWINDNQNWMYQWDWADRLTQVTSNNVVVLQNWYDAFGRRIAKSELVNGQMQKWLYLYDGWSIVGVMNGNGQLLETFTWGVGLRGDVGTLIAVTLHTGSSAGTYYVHNNHRGDVVLTRSGTTTIGSYTYSAFGLLTSTSGSDICRFKFSSKECEQTCGFSYYGYRFYAPQWQRWLSWDPSGQNDSNSYNFVLDNPVIFFDSFGLLPTGAGGGWWGRGKWGGLGGVLGFYIAYKADEKMANCPNDKCSTRSQCNYCCKGAFDLGMDGIILGGLSGGLGGGIAIIGTGAIAIAASSKLTKDYQDCIAKCQSHKD